MARSKAGWGPVDGHLGGVPRSRWGAATGLAAFGLVLCALLLWLVPSAVAAQPATAIAVHATSSRAVFGSDGREHIDYDLVITNAFTAPVTLDRLRVQGHGKTLLTLEGGALAAKTFQMFGTTPTAVIPSASTVVSYVDVALPRSAGRTAPKRLTNRLRYSLPSTAPAVAAIGSTLVRLPLRTEPIRPLVIRSPLHGSGWIAANSCCADPTSPHRKVLLATSRAYATPEIFAIDWIRAVDRFYFKGDGSQVADWLDYGAPIHAVADGTVVTAVNDRPNVAPFITSNPTVRKPADYAGNNVVERIAPHRYAIYAHMQPGSVRVKVGQRLKTGERIGLLGNSGNTTAPHLHFGIYDGPDPLTSNSVPLEIRQYRFQGNAGPGGNTAGQITLMGKPRRERRSEPLINSVSEFP
jgi:hypothetical protein